MAYDAARGLTLLFGGYNATAAPLGDFWAFNGTGWQQLGGTVPAPRWGHSMVYDSRRERVVLFGGFEPSPGNPIPDAIGFGDTWEYDGFGWTQVATTGPSPRGYFGMAYDPIRQRTVLFGGAGPNTTYLQDTWEWNGVAWTQVSTPAQPSTRRGPAMAFDLERAEMVLFGGGALGTQFGDTWTYNGTTWTQRAPLTSPPARWESAMVFDPQCGEARLQGGTTFNYQTIYADSWRWNGTTWTQVLPSQPSARHGVAASFDLQARRSLWFGGRDSAGFRSDLWGWSVNCLRTMTTVTPAVAGQTAQYRYNYPATATNNVYLELWTVRNPNAFSLQIPGFVSVGLTRVDLFFILLQIPGVLGASGQQNTVPFAIPSSPAVVGFTFDVQDLDIDLASNHLYWAVNDVQATVAPFPAPIANFTATPITGFAPLTVQFADTSTNTPTSWQWDFETDGIVDSTQQNPVWTYTSPGTFSARLVASSQWGQGIAHQTILVDVPPPTASFTAAPNTGTYPLSVQFTNTSQVHSAFPIWRWDFQNDGVVDSTAQNPSFTYTTAGTYSVRLLVMDTGGTDTVTQTGLISVGEPPSFTATPAFGAAPLPVQFAGTAPFPVTSWQWDFQNDGVIDSAGQNPTFTYTSNGIYTVRLVVTTTAVPLTRTATRAAVIVFNGGVNPSLNMVAIASGTFQMGSPEPIGVAPYYNSSFTQPVHLVTISQPFWMGRNEVTQIQYQSVMGSNPSFFQGAAYPNAANSPVEQVAWAQAVAYCDALTVQEAAAGRLPPGYEYRLPTEAEWEYCCRAGTTTEFHYGASLLCGQANFSYSYHGSSSCSNPGGVQTAVVGSYLPNAFGLYDMHGNVSEMCADGWNGSFNYSAGAFTDPYVPASAPSALGRIFRGGSWNDASIGCRSTVRGIGNPSVANYVLGFRVVCAPVLP